MLVNPSDILWEQVILTMMMVNMMKQVMHDDPVLACKEEESLEGFLRRRLNQLNLPFQLVHIITSSWFISSLATGINLSL